MISPLSNIDGKPVDWWFMYKLPMDIGPQKNSTGFEFLYCDSNSTNGLSLSTIKLNQDNSALALTLNQIFSGSPDVGYVMWNDEIPPTANIPDPENNSGKGHSKGVLAFSKKKDCALYLLHSTPRFPAVGTIDLPDDEKRFGQIYSCISFKNYAQATELAHALNKQVQAQVYSSLLPDIDPDEAIYKLGKNIDQLIPVSPSILELCTPKMFDFIHISKNKKWSEPIKPAKVGKDFWKDLLGPNFACNINVETWRRGQVFSDVDPDEKDDTKDNVDIDLEKIGLEGYKWPYSKDHSKWGISVKNKNPLVIISDLNRQVSQCKRGGGGLIFNHKGLWESLNAIEITERNLETKVHIDKS